MRRLLIAFILLALSGCEPAYGDEIDDIIPHIIQVESSGNPSAVSRCGAVGLMQITSIALKEFNLYYGGILSVYTVGMSKHDRDNFRYTLNDMKIPWKNKNVGDWYLRRLRDYYLKERFELLDKVLDNYTDYGPGIYDWSKNIRNLSEFKLALILAAYNGGITRLRKANYDINKMPRETRRYVKKVMRLYKEPR